MKKIRIAALLTILAITGLVGLTELSRHLDPEGYARAVQGRERERAYRARVEDRKGLPSRSELIGRQKRAMALEIEARRVRSLRYQGYTDDEIRILNTRRSR